MTPNEKRVLREQLLAIQNTKDEDEIQSRISFLFAVFGLSSLQQDERRHP